MEINGEAWLLERKMFQTKVVKTNEMHFLSLHPFHKAYRFSDSETKGILWLCCLIT